MKVMVFVQMEPKDETGAMPSEELLAAMGAYNEELVKAGIMLEVGGLKPTSAGARVAFQGGTTSVVDGPFTESKEIVVGYWVWEVGSLEEAVEWARRCPSDPDRTTTPARARVRHLPSGAPAGVARGVDACGCSAG